MYIGRQIENIREQDIKLGNKTYEDEEMRLLWGKQQLIFKHLADYWKPLIIKGKTCFDYMHGNIFDAQTRSDYEVVQKKICIEPRLMKPRINSLVGEIMGMKRTGKIATEGGMSAAEVSLANLILKYFEQEIEEEDLHNEMLFNGCVSCTPQVLLFDHVKTAYGDQMAGLTAEVLDWDSFVLSKGLRKADGSDATNFIYMARQSKKEMIEQNPEREEAIDKHFALMKDGTLDCETLERTNGLTIEDARFLYYDVLTGQTHTTVDGRMLVMQRFFPAKVKTEVAIAIESEDSETLDYQIQPGTWSDERWEKWKKKNASKYVIANPEINILWMTRWTREGLMLKNEAHWFQEHNNKGQPILPISVFVPQIIDGVTSGPGVDMQHKLLMKAIAETEYLHDIRCGSGDILAYKSDHVQNFADLPQELSRGNGIIILDGDEASGKVKESVDFLKRTPNRTFGEYSEKVTQDLDATDLISRTVQGASLPEQSGKAKNIDITRAVVGYNVVSANFNKTFKRTKNLECMLIPYVFTEEQAIQITDDEENENLTVTVNEEEIDLNGDVVGLTNNLTDCKWKYRLVPGDDSPTAREAELKEMLLFWNTAAPTLIEADPTLGILASVLKSMSNHTANKTGTLIADKAQVQAEQMNQQQMAQLMADLEERKAKSEAETLKAQRSGFSFSVTPEDLAYIPGMYQILTDGNYINTANNNQFQLPQEQEMVA